MNLPGMAHFGTYQIISADPPWEHDNYGQKEHGSAKANFPEMPLATLKEMPVGALADPLGALLLLWCTGVQAADGAHVELATAWGFRLTTRLLSWVKVYERCTACDHPWEEHVEPLVAEDAPGACGGSDHECECEQFLVRAMRGPGNYSMQGVEDLWLGVRGDATWSKDRAVRNIPEILFAPRLRPHSTKPERAYARIEALWPKATRRLELFARARRPDWAAWGNQAPDCDLVFGDQIGTSWPVPVKAEVAHG